MRNVATRTGLFLATLWLILTAGFLCVYKLPGDPARMILGRQASEETLEQFRLHARLNEPLWNQYVFFTRRIITGDLGDSLLYRRPVAGLVAERSGMTARLVGCSLVFVVVIAFVVPILLRLVGSISGRATFQTIAVAFGIAPPYVAGVLALALFAGKLGWINVIFDPTKISNWILPSLVLAAYPASVVMRLFDSELNNSVRSLFVLRARAMGASAFGALLREAVPNALTAALPALANAMAVFLTGTFFVEVIFGISGLGRLTYEAISNKDITLLSTLCLLFAAAICLVSTLLEIVRLAIDPRLRSPHG